MLNDIVGIKIFGANYITDTNLRVFNPNDGENSNKRKIVKGTNIWA